MELQVGDRLSDETGEEWEVIGRPYATGGGKNAHARLQRVGDPAAQEVRSWSAYERQSGSPTSESYGEGFASPAWPRAATSTAPWRTVGEHVGSDLPGA